MACRYSGHNCHNRRIMASQLASYAEPEASGRNLITQLAFTAQSLVSFLSPWTIPLPALGHQGWRTRSFAITGPNPILFLLHLLASPLHVFFQTTPCSGFLTPAVPRWEPRWDTGRVNGDGVCSKDGLCWRQLINRCRYGDMHIRVLQ